MINKEKIFNIAIIYVLFIWFIFQSCSKQDSLTFEKQRMDTSFVQDCVNDDCASIEINLLQCLTDSEICKKINKEIKNNACRILIVGENEAEETLEFAINEFDSFYQEMRSEFPEETVPYEVNIDYEASFLNADIISVIVDFYTFTGGAHGYGGVTFLNFDPQSGKPFLNSSILKDENAFRKHIETIFREQNGIAQNESINSTGFFFENDTFALPQTIGFSDKEVVFLYNQYDIASYADGPIELKLKKSEIASFFNINIQ